MTAQQTATTTPAQNTTSELFWVMTVQPAQKAAGVTALATFKGTFTPVPGDTRRDAFQKIRDYVSDQLVRGGQPAEHTVLFYSLEPNQL